MVTVAAMSTSDTSDTSDDGGSPLGGSDICRDFLRNVCKRGKRCKFRHPLGTEARQLGRKHDYTFCHDFQNSGCRRANCRFIHCSRDEEEYYKQTGQLPIRLQQAAALGIGVLPADLPLLRGEVPICKDFLKGECKRSTKCKFRHLSSTQYEIQLRRPDDPSVAAAAAAAAIAAAGITEYTTIDVPYESVLKRKRTEEVYVTAAAAAALTATDYRLLEEENAMLRRKVDELKKQVSDLMATNEVLLEQNARYRVSKAVSVSTCSPLVTVTTPITRSACMTPIAVAQPIHRLSTTVNTLPQLRVDSTELLVSSRLAAELAQQPGAAAAAAAAAVAAVALTPASAQPPPPPSSLSSMCSPMCGQSATASLVSYPIMSHTLINSTQLG